LFKNSSHSSWIEFECHKKHNIFASCAVLHSWKRNIPSCTKQRRKLFPMHIPAHNLQSHLKAKSTPKKTKILAKNVILHTWLKMHTNTASPKHALQLHSVSLVSLVHLLCPNLSYAERNLLPLFSFCLLYFHGIMFPISNRTHFLEILPPHLQCCVSVCVCGTCVSLNLPCSYLCFRVKRIL